MDNSLPHKLDDNEKSKEVNYALRSVLSAQYM